LGTVLTGATICTASGAFRADLRLEGETVDSVGFGLARPGDAVVDLPDRLLLPGAVDVHTHFDLPLTTTSTADDFASGTAAALLGGTTTVVDYATAFRGQSAAEGIEAWHGRAEGRAFCDYAFHLALTDWNGSLAEELPSVIDGGISSFKLYMAYKGSLQVDDGALYAAARRIGELGGLLCVHCENGDLVAARAEELVASGVTGPAGHPLSRPASVEAEAVGRMIAIADLARCPLYVVHVSAERSMREIVMARRRGQPLFAETCPQYLLLDEGRYGREGLKAAAFVLAPPLRSAADGRALWGRLARGEIDTVATDHCSFTLAQKAVGLDDFRLIPNGLPGVEHRLVLLYSEGVAKGRLSLERFVDSCCTAPARLFGLRGKGSLEPGSDGDVVVFDPRVEWVLSASNQHHRTDYTPYEGLAVKGRVESVFLRGRRLVDGGTLLDGTPRGRYRRRQPFSKGVRP
jgi:dihydropyrimidinase